MKVLQKQDCSEYLLQKKLRTYLSNPQYVCENLYVFGWESDMLIKTRSGYWYEIEIECKISLADFKHDFTKKEKHNTLRGERVYFKCANYFLYCVPWYLEEQVTPLVPEYAGLIILKQNGALHVAKKPPVLHKEKYTDQQMNLCEKFYYNWRKEVDKRERSSQQEYIKQLRAKIDLLKAEYKAATGTNFDEYLKDAL